MSDPDTAAYLGAGMVPPDTLGLIGVYFRNDQPGGFGFVIPVTGPAVMADLQRVHDVFMAELAVLEEEHGALQVAHYIFERYIMVASQDVSARQEMALVLHAAFRWLILRGFMVDDEYNGVNYTYQIESAELFAPWSSLGRETGFSSFENN